MRILRSRATKLAAAASAMALVGSLAGACTSGIATASSDQAGTSSSASDSGPHITTDNPPEPGNVYGNAADISVPSGSCVFLVFNGADKSGRAVAFAGQPGTDVSYGKDLDLWAVPGCDSARDYIIGTGIIHNALGEGVGDRAQPAPGDAPAYTKNGTAVWVTLRVDWDLNKSEPALLSFWKWVCVKFVSCATKVTDPNNPPDLGSTSSTRGWLRWQGELMGPAIDSLVRQLMNNYTDEIITNASLQNDLAKNIALGFTGAFANTTGQSLPLLCGPGNSFWKDIQKNDYHCSPVHVSDVHVVRDSDYPFGLGPAMARQIAACKALGPQCTWNMGNPNLVLPGTKK